MNFVCGYTLLRGGLKMPVNKKVYKDQDLANLRKAIFNNDLDEFKILLPECRITQLELSEVVGLGRSYMAIELARYAKKIISFYHSPQHRCLLVIYLN